MIAIDHNRIRETLLTAPYGTPELLDAVEVIDGDKGLLAAWQARLKVWAVEDAEAARRDEEEKVERDRMFEPANQSHYQTNQGGGRSNDWFQRQALRHWPGSRASYINTEGEEE